MRADERGKTRQMSDRQLRQLFELFDENGGAVKVDERLSNIHDSTCDVSEPRLRMVTGLSLTGDGKIVAEELAHVLNMLVCPMPPAPLHPCIREK